MSSLAHDIRTPLASLKLALGRLLYPKADFQEVVSALRSEVEYLDGLIANLVAIPKMQKERPYPTLLDRDGSTTAPFPGQPGQVTVLLLDQLQVTAIEYRDSPEGLRELVSKTR